ncbi:methyl-accepting chemotaxis protein [Caballeronia sp.]|uniref:methyl-accepting chemotaxis protein n=1 Tax=Caballeronia sp. TaxID=1931223 RepID=UPI003C5F75AB
MNKLRIKTRLTTLVAALLALVLLTSVMGTIRLQQANAAIETIYNDRVVCLGQLKAIADDYSASVIGTAYKARDGAISPPQAIRVIIAARARIAKHWQDHAGTPLVAQEKALVTQAEPLMMQADVSIDHLLKLLETQDTEHLREYVTSQMHPAMEPLLAVLGQLANLQIDEAQHEYAAAHHMYRRFVAVNAVLTGLTLCAAALTCWLLIRSITNPLSEAVRVAQTVASGDLTSTISVTGRDETSDLLRALKHMNDRLVDIVGGVRSSSEAIGSATKQIAAGNIDLSSRTEQQAASLEETAASMEQLTSTVRHNAANARHASALAGSASDIAARGNEVVKRVVGTMDAISESSGRIADIIGMIEGIAFQTNILALNAAVEAARAGEQGRGFAVVAQEVRALAQRSSSSAKEIKDLISTSAGRVAAGTELASQAGQTMQEIIHAVSLVTGIMSEIAVASDEQSKGIDQVGQAVTQMDEVTQQNAALVEEAAAAAQSLQDQAFKLNAAVAVFSVV